MTNILRALTASIFLASSIFLGVSAASASESLAGGDCSYCRPDGVCQAVTWEAYDHCIYDPFPPYCSGHAGFCVLLSQSEVGSAN